MVTKAIVDCYKNNQQRLASELIYHKLTVVV